MQDKRRAPDRRRVLGGAAAMGGLLGLNACATAAGPMAARPRAGRDGITSLPRMRAHPDRIFDVKCCIRPFRPQGPRLDAEVMGDTLVIHNYGHGGSGWSLSWGSAAIAVEKAMTTLPDRVAVIGCGVIGLTSAIQAQRAGAQVTIYTRELLPKTRSVRANGSWTPDSRISLAEPAGPEFAALWEQMARTSWKTFRSYLGLPGRPVDFCDQYNLSDTPFKPRHDAPNPEITESFATDGLPHQNAEFGYYSEQIKDLTPTPQDLPEGSTPFPTKFVRKNEIMFFNFGSLGQVLMAEFLQMGGKVVIRQFNSPAEIKQLPEKVVINCPGYAASSLWQDKGLIPVRGQTAWLIPQPEVNYGVTYNGASALSKSDGIMVMGGTAMKGGDMANIGNSNEIEDRAEAEEAVGIIEALFNRFPANGFA